MHNDSNLKNSWLLPGLVFFVSLVTNLFILSHVAYKIVPDSLGYIRVAKNFVKHGALLENDYIPGTLIPFTERMPGYPFFLSGLFKVFTEESSALFVAGISNALFLATAALLIFYLASYSFSVQIGFIAGILAALDPWSKLISPMILTDSLFYLATTVSICVGVYALSRKKPRTMDFFFWGISIGLASMVRPVFNYFGVVILVVVFVNYKFKQGVYLFCICMVGISLILGGWIYRNHQVAGFWGMQTSDGISILWSNFKLTRASTPEDYITNPDIATARDMIANAENPIKLMTPLRQALNASPAKVNYLFRSVGVENIVNNPLAVSIIYGKNLIKIVTTIFNSSSKLESASSYPIYIVWGEKIGSCLFFLLLPCATFFVAWRKSYRKKEFVFFAMVLAYVLLLSSLVAGSFRYRFPVHGIFWVVDAVFLSFAFDCLRARFRAMSPKT